VHKFIFQCTNTFFSAQVYFSVHKCIFQCTTKKYFLQPPGNTTRNSREFERARMFRRISFPLACPQIERYSSTTTSLLEELYRELDRVCCHERKAHRLQRSQYTNHGPNFAWHTDGYDILRPYGFPKHG